MSIAYYRTKDGSGTDYVFDIVEQISGNWQVYIVSQPSYAGRPTDADSTHRLGLVSGRPYVCWTQPIRSREDAKRVAEEWADRTQSYIRTGVALERQG